MSGLGGLVTELCSNGVEFKTLGEVGELMRGRRFTKADYVESGLGSIHYGEVYTSFGTWTDQAKSFVRPDLESRLRLARPGDVIIAATGESVDEVGKAVAWLGEGEIAIHDDCYILRHSLDPKFVAYFFQSSAFHLQKLRFVTESKLARIAGAGLAAVKIPVPPVAVQRAIVEILDQMEQLVAELEAELESELEGRTRQYAHHRTALLSDVYAGGTDGVIGDFLDLKAGKFIAAGKISPGMDSEHPYPCFGGGGLRGYVGVASHQGPMSLIGRQGALCGNVKRADGRFYATEHAVVVSPRQDVVSRWAHHKLVEMNLNQYASKSAQPGLSVSVISRLPVHLPPLVEQRRVADILDAFDALVNDLSSGLSTEIAARRRQYEYYRDSLLMFQEKTA